MPLTLLGSDDGGTRCGAPVVRSVSHPIDITRTLRRRACRHTASIWHRLRAAPARLLLLLLLWLRLHAPAIAHRRMTFKHAHTALTRCRDQRMPAAQQARAHLARHRQARRCSSSTARAVVVVVGSAVAARQQETSHSPCWCCAHADVSKHTHNLQRSMSRACARRDQTPPQRALSRR
jgi:hypothetical protein